VFRSGSRHRHDGWTRSASVTQRESTVIGQPAIALRTCYTGLQLRVCPSRMRVTMVDKYLKQTEIRGTRVRSPRIKGGHWSLWCTSPPSAPAPSSCDSSAATPKQPWHTDRGTHWYSYPYATTHTGSSPQSARNGSSAATTWVLGFPHWKEVKPSLLGGRAESPYVTVVTYPCSTDAATIGKLSINWLNWGTSCRMVCARRERRGCGSDVLRE